MLDNFNLQIEKLAAKHKSYIAAICEFAEENGIDEFEEVIPCLNSIILEKVKTEFIKKNFFSNKKITNALDSFF